MKHWKDAADCAAALRELSNAVESSLKREGGSSDDEQEQILRALLMLARELVQRLCLDPRIGVEAQATFEHELRFVVTARVSLAENARRYS